MSVMIGIDPAKGSHAVAAVNGGEVAVAEFEVRATRRQVSELLAWAERFPNRSWAIESANGHGYLLAQQLVATGEHVVDVALEHTEMSPRQLAWHITDNEGYFISESSVYRILKSYDLITCPAFELVSAKDEFEHKTKRVNEMWQTDFTQFKVIDWGYYYLCTILDDYSRYILAWRLAPTMGSTDVEDTLKLAMAKTKLTHIKVKHRPRLLSDNGSAFISHDLKQFLDRYKMDHVRGAPYHPQTQGKIERYHRSMKSIVKLDNYYSPTDLEQAIADFVCYYNTQRYHESLENVTPADVYFGRQQQILTQRDLIKQQTLQQRRQDYLQHMAGVG